MSLLNVYVIFAYYIQADKHKTRKDKITNQKFDNNYVTSKIQEISEYHSSALHWNLKEIKENLSDIMDMVKKSYSSIEDKLKVRLHDSKGLDNFQNELQQGCKSFMEFSRVKAKRAQSSEFQTIQPKEALSTKTKAKITISNYLGGMYYLTVDEIDYNKNTVCLIECKHTSSSLIPSRGSIKDGLLKMVLFSNLQNLKVDNKKFNYKPILKLTSSKIKGKIASDSTNLKFNKFLIDNKFKTNQENFVKNLFKEANTNKIIIIIQRKIKR